MLFEFHHFSCNCFNSYLLLIRVIIFVLFFYWNLIKLAFSSILNNKIKILCNLINFDNF